MHLWLKHSNSLRWCQCLYHILLRGGCILQPVSRGSIFRDLHVKSPNQFQRWRWWLFGIDEGRYYVVHHCQTRRGGNLDFPIGFTAPMTLITTNLIPERLRLKVNYRYQLLHPQVMSDILIALYPSRHTVLWSRFLLLLPTSSNLGCRRSNKPARQGVRKCTKNWARDWFAARGDAAAASDPW